MKTSDAIELKTAEARFTRAKKALDGSERKEVLYQEAKQSLASLRIRLRNQRTHVRSGSATAKPTSLKASTSSPRKGT